MKFNKYLILVFAFLLIAVKSTDAQSGGINLTLGFPMEEFKENVNRIGFGVSAQFLIFEPRPKMPFGFGINLGFINYGSESRRERFSTTIPDVYVDVDRTNNLANFHLLFKVAPPHGRVRPYIEGLFGGSYIFTETKIHSDYNNEKVASTTNFDDFAWSYGGGAGLMIQVGSGGNGDVGAIFIDLKGRYLFGTEAEYLKEGSVTIENGYAYYDVSRSKTDLLTVNLGVTAFFNSLWN